MPSAIITCSPLFTDLALNELTRQHPTTITVKRQLSAGCILIHARQSYDNLTRPWRHRLPTYLHHIAPVHHRIDLIGQASDLAHLHREAKRHFHTRQSMTVQPRLIHTNDAKRLPYNLSDVIEVLASINGYVRANGSPAGRVLSVTIATHQNAPRAYLGKSWASQNLSQWASGIPPRDEQVLNRAGYKLLDALNDFDIHLRSGDHALDLGASPGAWTQILRQRGLNVTAVAPMPLHLDLKQDDGVHFYHMRAEDYLSHVTITFDLIVNDMKMDGQDSARLMVAYARHLRNNGVAIMTLKLRRQSRRRVMDHSLRLLRPAYKIIRVRQLVSNRHEVTLFLRKIN